MLTPTVKPTHLLPTAHPPGPRRPTVALPRPPRAAAGHDLRRAVK
jgi:hypothetical protein